MTANPTSWSANSPVTAFQLNTDLYNTTPGNNNFPSGLLFHSLPPMILENLHTPVSGGQGSSSGGTFTDYAAATFWRSAIDNSCYFGAGGDQPGTIASGQFGAVVPGSSGDGINSGGYYFIWGVAAIAPTSNAQGFGSAFFSPGGATQAVGGAGLTSTTRDNAELILDVTASPTAMSVGGWCVDSSGSSFATRANATDFMGETCLFGALWAGPTAGGATVPTSLPVPTTGYTGASTITSAGMNGNGLAAPLAFLNNPPLLRVQGTPTTSIATSATVTATAVPLTFSPTPDTWSKYSTGTSLYTVPVTGVYLVQGVLTFGNNTTGQRAAGIRVNGTTTVWGPAFSAAGGISPTRPQVIRLLDLQAGDTVGLVCSQNSGGALALSSGLTSCLIIRFMGAQAGSSGSVSWNPPDTSFRWQAGTPGSQLSALFNTHLGNDLSFLIQRPYLMAYQTVQQTGLARNAFQVITMDSVTGRVHGSAGDNYGGWVSGAANRYVAARPGWYFAFLHVAQTPPTTAPAQCVAAIGYFQSGGAAQGSANQQWGQQVRAASTTGYNVGAEAIGMFYLRTGDYLQPQYQQMDGGATFSTAVSTAAQESSFGVVWVSELERDVVDLWSMIKDIVLTGTGVALIISQMVSARPQDALLVTGLALTVPSMAEKAKAVLSGPSGSEGGKRRPTTSSEPQSSASPGESPAP